MHRRVQRRATSEHPLATGRKKCMHRLHHKDGRLVGIEREWLCLYTLFGKRFGFQRVSWRELRDNAIAAVGRDLLTKSAMALHLSRPFEANIRDCKSGDAVWLVMSISGFHKRLKYRAAIL
jgi:hypothetical protein